MGITPGALATGAGNALTISGSTATFAAALPGNIGVGDVIKYDSDNSGTITPSDAIAFIHGRTDSHVFTVKDKSGATPTPVAGDTDWSVFRAYRSLADWESQTENPSILEPSENDVNPSPDLVTAGTIMNVACYADGADTAAVTITGWTTGAATYIDIFTPYQPSHVGASQRHSGVWDTSKYRLVASKPYGGILCHPGGVRSCRPGCRSRTRTPRTGVPRDRPLSGGHPRPRPRT